jgi:putative copper resistance protein D
MALTVTAQISILTAVARWLTLSGIALMMGLFTFRLFVWNPIVADVDLEAEETTLDLWLARVGIRIGISGILLIGLGLILTFIDQTRVYDLLQTANLSSWIRSRFGAMWLVRLLLLAISHFNLSLFVDVKSGRKELRGWEWWLGLLLTVGMTLTVALISHSAALVEDAVQSVVIDWIHLLAGMVWAGGLLFLALSLWQARRLPNESRSWLNLSLMLNFSATAAIAMGLLLSSGGYLAGKHVGGWTALIGTAYGLLLLGKIGLALLAIGIAGVNLFFIKPRLTAIYENRADDRASVLLRRFNRLVWLELGLALLILAASGLLTDLQRGVDPPLLADVLGKTVVVQLDGELRPLETAAKWMNRTGSGATGAGILLFALIWSFVAVRAAKNEAHLVVLLAISLVCFWIGSSQLYNFFTNDFTPAKFTTNPILPDVESIATGQALFAENCAACHGTEGRGDGPDALSLSLPPADFAAGHTATHTDGDLFFWILQGVEESEMPAFEEQFTEEQVWHLVNYVRRLSVQDDFAP